jgi:hypothetical protein
MSSGPGLHKDAIRRIVLAKLAVVYRDWGFDQSPFADFATIPGERRDDARAFIIALVAALLGGLADAIDQNNEAIGAVLVRRHRLRATRRASAAAIPLERRRALRHRRS